MLDRPPPPLDLAEYDEEISRCISALGSVLAAALPLGGAAPGVLADLGRTAAGLLHFDVADLLGQGVVGAREVRAAARRTIKNNPDARDAQEEIVLCAHKASSAWSTELQFVRREIPLLPVIPLGVELALTADVRALVKGGTVHQVGYGRVDWSCALQVAGHDAWSSGGTVCDGGSWRLHPPLAVIHPQRTGSEQETAADRHNDEAVAAATSGTQDRVDDRLPRPRRSARHAR